VPEWARRELEVTKIRNKNQWLFEAKSLGGGNGWVCPYDGQHISFSSGPTGCSNPDCPSYELKDFRPSRNIAESLLKEGERLIDYGYAYNNGQVHKNWLVFDDTGHIGVIFISDTNPNEAIRSFGFNE
jgi:hypothetical protein